jgi:hypothetical protein
MEVTFWLAAMKSLAGVTNAMDGPLTFTFKGFTRRQSRNLLINILYLPTKHGAILQMTTILYNKYFQYDEHANIITCMIDYRRGVDW